MTLLQEKMGDLLNLDLTDEIKESILAAYEKFKMRGQNYKALA